MSRAEDNDGIHSQVFTPVFPTGSSSEMQWTWWQFFHLVPTNKSISSLSTSEDEGSDWQLFSSS